MIKISNIGLIKPCASLIRQHISKNFYNNYNLRQESKSVG